MTQRPCQILISLQPFKVRVCVTNEILGVRTGLTFRRAPNFEPRNKKTTRALLHRAGPWINCYDKRGRAKYLPSEHEWLTQICILARTLLPASLLLWTGP